jgi:hypothetical protein
LRLNRELVLERIRGEQGPIDIPEVRIPREDVSLYSSRFRIERFDPARDLFFPIAATHKPGSVSWVSDLAGPASISLGCHALRQRDEERLLIVGDQLKQMAQGFGNVGPFAFT